MNVVVLFRHEMLVKGVLKNLNSLGARVHVVTAVQSAAVRLSRFCHRYNRIKLPAGPVYSLEFIGWMNRYAAKHDIDVIVPADVESARFLSVNRFGLIFCECYPISRKDVLLTLDNKRRFAAFLERQGIAAPPTAVVSSLDDLDQGVLDGVSFPVVVKPPAASGGTGVVEQDSPGALRRYLESGDEHAALPVVVQQFVPGETVGINILAQDGEVVAWTIQREPDRRTLIYVEDKRILALGERVIAALDYTGFANIDLRVRDTDGEPFIIECNPRFGFRTWVSALFGINFVDLGLRIATKAPLPGQNGYRLGRYDHHRTVLKTLLWRRAEVSQLSSESRQGLRLVASDPLPPFYEHCRRYFKHGAMRLGLLRADA